MAGRFFPRFALAVPALAGIAAGAPVRPSFAEGLAASALCPEGSEPISDAAACHHAASAFDLTYSWTVESDERPRGCYHFSSYISVVRFNSHKTGGANEHSKVLCAVTDVLQASGTGIAVYDGSYKVQNVSGLMHLALKLMEFPASTPTVFLVVFAITLATMMASVVALPLGRWLRLSRRLSLRPSSFSCGHAMFAMAALGVVALFIACGLFALSINSMWLLGVFAGAWLSAFLSLLAFSFFAGKKVAVTISADAVAEGVVVGSGDIMPTGSEAVREVDFLKQQNQKQHNQKQHQQQQKNAAPAQGHNGGLELQDAAQRSEQLRRGLQQPGPGQGAGINAHASNFSPALDAHVSAQRTDGFGRQISETSSLLDADFSAHGTGFQVRQVSGRSVDVESQWRPPADDEEVPATYSGSAYVPHTQTASALVLGREEDTWHEEDGDQNVSV